MENWAGKASCAFDVLTLCLWNLRLISTLLTLGALNFPFVSSTTHVAVYCTFRVILSDLIRFRGVNGTIQRLVMVIGSSTWIYLYILDLRTMMHL